MHNWMQKLLSTFLSSSKQNTFMSCCNSFSGPAWKHFFVIFFWSMVNWVWDLVFEKYFGTFLLNLHFTEMIWHSNFPYLNHSILKETYLFDSFHFNVTFKMCFDKWVSYILVYILCSHPRFLFPLTYFSSQWWSCYVMCVLLYLTRFMTQFHFM